MIWNDQAVVSNLYILKSQLSLQNRTGKFTNGIASSVFSFPWRILMIKFLWYISKRVHIYFMFVIWKVIFSSLNDSILSVRTSFLRFHWLITWPFLYTYPVIKNLSPSISSPSFKLISKSSKISFSTTILANKM